VLVVPITALIFAEYRIHVCWSLVDLLFEFPQVNFSICISVSEYCGIRVYLKSIKECKA